MGWPRLLVGVATAGVALFIGAAAAGAASPAIAMNPSVGPPGTSVTVSGTGFPTSDVQAMVTWDGASWPNCQLPVHVIQGSFTAQCLVPQNAPAGQHKIGATSFPSNSSAPSQPFSVTSPPPPPPAPPPPPPNPPPAAPPPAAPPAPATAPAPVELPSFALVVRVEPAKALAGLNNLPTALTSLVGADLVSTPVGWTAALGSRPIQSWPERVTIADGVFLDLLRVTLDGQPVALSSAPPSTERHVYELVVTPAYRVDVGSSYGTVFGGGVYRYGAAARIGVGYDRIAMDGPLGLLGGQIQFAGWDGLNTDQATTTVTVSGPRTLNATWRDDVTAPGVVFGVLALVLLLVTVPGGLGQPPPAGADTAVAIAKRSVLDGLTSGVRGGQ